MTNKNFSVGEKIRCTTDGYHPIYKNEIVTIKALINETFIDLVEYRERCNINSFEKINLEDLKIGDRFKGPLNKIYIVEEVTQTKIGKFSAYISRRLSDSKIKEICYYDIKELL